MLNPIADYRDGSGHYTIRVYGEWMVTDFDGEVWASRLTRAPYLDQWEDWGEWVLDSRAPAFYSTPDAPGPFGRPWRDAVRIGDEAYTVGQTVDADDAVGILTRSGAEFGPDDDPLEVIGQGLTLPDAAPVVGALPLEVDDSAEFPAYLVAIVRTAARH